jgi:hypothetical protein
MSNADDTAENAQRAEPAPGPDETVCYICRKVIKSNAWTCPYCGKIFEKLLLSTLTLDSLSGPQKEAFSRGYEDCKARWKETKDISVSISTYKPLPGYENAYRAGWKKAADELEIRGETKRHGTGGRVGADTGWLWKRGATVHEKRRRTLTVVAVVAFVASLISVVGALKTDLRLSRRQADLARLEKATKVLQEEIAKGRQLLAESENRRRQWPFTILGEKTPSQLMVERAEQLSGSLLQNQVNDLQGVVESNQRAMTIWETELRQGMLRLYILYGLAFVMAVVGVIILRYRSFRGSTEANPLRVVGP